RRLSWQNLWCPFGGRLINETRLSLRDAAIAAGRLVAVHQLPAYAKTVIIFDVPGATSEIVPMRINLVGEITGYYRDAQFRSHGWRPKIAETVRLRHHQ